MLRQPYCNHRTNTLGVRAIHPVPPVYVRGQIEAVMEDIRPDAVKIGMINDVEMDNPVVSRSNAT